MDITVTTPLEMGVGQQKYVVAYTLKQGVEKQPDIINAQKTTDNIDSVQKMGSPAAIRPDALFSTSSSSSSSKPSKSSSSPYDHQQKMISPSSQQNSLKHNDSNNKNYMPLNQTLASNYNNHPPPYCSTMLNEYDYETPLNYSVSYSATSGTSNNNNYHKMSPEYNNLNNLLSGANNVASGGIINSNNELLTNPDTYLEFERTTLDHRLLGNNLNNNSNKDNNLEYISNRSNGPTNPFSTDPDIESEQLDYKNLANQIATTISNINSTLNRSRNRNRILTDTLPGPESCV
jgi:hypothetical protein